VDELAAVDPLVGEAHAQPAALLVLAQPSGQVVGDLLAHPPHQRLVDRVHRATSPPTRATATSRAERSREERRRSRSPAGWSPARAWAARSSCGRTAKGSRPVASATSTVP